MVQLINPKTNQPFEKSASAIQYAPTAYNKPIDAYIQSRKVQSDIAALEASLDHGYAQTGVQLHIDNMVGNLFRCNYQPMAERLGLDEATARSFSNDVEDWWNELAEDPRAYLDAEEKRTFTMIMREVAGGHCRAGEWMAQPLWQSRIGTRLRTCIKVINPNRVSNPNGIMDSATLRGGIGMTTVGAPRFYHVQQANHGLNSNRKWIRIPKRNRVGRNMFLHIFEPMADGQTRAPTQFLSIIKRLGKLDKFQDTALENAIVNALFATVIESELDAEQAFELISQDKAGTDKLTHWMSHVADYHDNQKGLIMGNGVRAAHLLPGEQMNVKRAGVDGAGITEYERSILRYIAAGLNVSYEQLAKDYSQVSYSSARASLMETWRYMMGRRKVIVARAASEIFTLCFEDALDSGDIVLPRKARFGFYESRHAWTNTEWIGTGRIAIDELKEVKAAAERIAIGVSTLEDECAVLGKDYRKVLAQRAREITETQGLNVQPYMNNRTPYQDEPEQSQGRNNAA